MKQMKVDLATKLDCIAADHHNTGYSCTHILAHSVTDDGKMLSIVYGLYYIYP